MEIHVKQSTIIRPAQETPKHFLPLTDLDLVAPQVYVPSVFFYRQPNDSSNFFEAALLKEALSKVLVSFYPLAGRLKNDENGRMELDCNGKGILFVEAEANWGIDDFGDFSEVFKLLPLFPTVDDTKDMFSRELMIAQVTHLSCGGASVGVKMHHILADAHSKYHFINSWAEMTRGLSIRIPPVFDRTLLNVGVPTSPTFTHIEYDPPPSLNSHTQNTESQPNPSSICTTIFKLSLNQMNMLKEKCKGVHGSTIKYSRFEILAAHMWRCLCKARGLSNDQATKIQFPVNGRSRLHPQLPYGYFGNVVFLSSLIEFSGNIQSEPLNHTVERIHNLSMLRDDKYLKSALAYLKQKSDPTILRRGFHTYKCPNFHCINSLQMPLYETNFGWGKPIFVRPVNTYFEGHSYILPTPANDGSILVSVNLETQHAQLFKKLFSEVFLQYPNIRSRH